MDHQLVVLRGRSASQVIKLLDGVNTAGRQDDCQLRIKSSMVSRRHCEIFEQGGQLVLKDLGSSNGTFVNKERVEGQRALLPGDHLTIGQVTFRVERIGEAPPPRPASTPSATPNDTAIVEALVDDGDDEEFDLDFFDDQPSALATPATAAAADDAIALEEEPAAAVAPAKAIAAPPAKKPEPRGKPAEPEPEAVPEGTPMPDDAIADFLLDIKIDDDE